MLRRAFTTAVVASFLPAGVLPASPSKTAQPAGTPTATGLFHPGPSVGDGGRKVVIADVNKDNHLDVVTGSGTNLVWLGDGQGQFVSTGQDFGGAGSWALAAGDVDNDGDVDVFLHKDSMMELWLGDGLGRFTDSGERMGYATIRHAFVADLDGDKSLDLVLVNEVAPNEVYFNNGQGQFRDSGQWLGSVQNRSYGGAALDFDGDGDADLVFTNLETSTAEVGSIHLFINDGRGQLTELRPGFGTPGLRYRTVAAGDLDGDGRPDLFVGREFGVEVWLNDGSQFVRAQELTSWASPWDVAVFDVDQDGDLDAVTAQYASQPSISEVWINDGAGGFLNSGRHLCCGKPFGIAVGDLNEDGAPDLFLSGQRGVAWFNQPTPPRFELSGLTETELAGRVSGLEVQRWESYFRVYPVVYRPGHGWSTLHGCEGDAFTRLDSDGAFAVNGLPQDATRIALFLISPNARINPFPCLDSMETVPHEIEILAIAKTTIERPRLTFVVENGRITFGWVPELAEVTLESAPEITGPWTRHAKASSGELTLPTDGVSRFFRLR